MNSTKTKKLIFASLFAALTCAATLIVKIPTPIGGYVHAGDTVVLLSALFLGGIYGAPAAGIGSAMADIISGYFIYAPGTLVIKAVVAIVAAVLINRKLGKNLFVKSVIAGCIAEILMVASYLFYDAVVLGFGAGAVADVPANLIQGAFGAIAAAALYSALNSSEYVRRVMRDIKE